MRDSHVSKNFFNFGTKITVISKTDVAYLLEIKLNKRVAYQVIDTPKDNEYPKNEYELQLVNVFRTLSREAAKEEYSNRNQIKIT